MSQWNVGARVRELRDARELSQGDVEKATGLPRCYTSRVENGHTVPGFDVLGKYADCFGIPLCTLLRPELAGEDVAFLKMVRTFELRPDEKKKLVKTIRSMAR